MRYVYLAFFFLSALNAADVSLEEEPLSEHEELAQEIRVLLQAKERMNKKNLRRSNPIVFKEPEEEVDNGYTLRQLKEQIRLQKQLAHPYQIRKTQ